MKEHRREDLNDHQLRLWHRMIHLIQKYLKGESNDFFGTVGELEGALYAAEIKDRNLVQRWFDFWEPLEIQRAVDGTCTDRLAVKKNLVAMKQFLLQVEVNQMNSQYKIDSVNSKKNFTDFIRSLSSEYIADPDSWRNGDIVTFLEAFAAWVDDMDGYYAMQGLPVPEQLDWKMIATMFMAAKMYE